LRSSLVGLLTAVLVAGCQVAPPPALFPAGEGELLVRLFGLRSDQGVAIVSLFAGAKGFPDDVAASLATVSVPILAGAAEVRFPALPYGEYAVSVLHDEDGDGEMATGMFGAPREGFGFSGRPDYRFGHPDFAATSFPLISPKCEVEIAIRYATGRRQHQEEGRGSEARRPRE
jgi:uncharacterized protein (DUF2141 family)